MLKKEVGRIFIYIHIYIYIYLNDSKSKLWKRPILLKTLLLNAIVFESKIQSGTYCPAFEGSQDDWILESHQLCL